MTWRQICLVTGCVMGDACIFARLLCTDVIFTREHFACYPLLGCCKMVEAHTDTCMTKHNHHLSHWLAHELCLTPWHQ